MKVKLSEIPHGGLTLTERFDPEQMQLQTMDLKFAAPVAVTANFQKERDTVVVHVETAGKLQLTCARCLAVYDESYENAFDFGYEVKGKLALDVTDDVRQEIMLSYPVKHLCREDCLGLCPGCGTNLNEGRCSCRR